VTGGNNLYRIDPSQPAGAVTTVATGAGGFNAAFDGSRIWTLGGSVSIVTPGATIPWTVTTVTTGFQIPAGGLYDGANIWVTDRLAHTLLKLDSSGAVLQTVTVGSQPEYPVFDGANIWVPNIDSNSVSVVRASSGAVLRLAIRVGSRGSDGHGNSASNSCPITPDTRSREVPAWRCTSGCSCTTQNPSRGHKDEGGNGPASSQRRTSNPCPRERPPGKGEDPTRPS
jgi:hypothetical protein